MLSTYLLYILSSAILLLVDVYDGNDFRLRDHKVEPNQEFQGLVCEGANVLPTKFIEDAFRDGYGAFSFAFTFTGNVCLKIRVLVPSTSHVSDVRPTLIGLSSYAGKVVNVKRLDEVINSIDNWYMERGLFGMVSFLLSIPVINLLAQCFFLWPVILH